MCHAQIVDRISQSFMFRFVVKSKKKSVLLFSLEYFNAHYVNVQFTPCIEDKSFVMYIQRVKCKFAFTKYRLLDY